MTTPETGYEVPHDALPGPRPAYTTSDDPLVAAPGSGYGAWARRLAATLRRSGGPLLALLLAATTAAALVQSLLTTVLSAAWRPGEVAWFLLIVDLASIGGLFITSIAWGAGIWLVTQQAAGGPVRLGAALATGARRGPAMFGWALVLFAPVTVAGTLSYQLSGSTLLALLPVALYWGLAGSLFSYAVIYERGATAMPRSVALVHRGFGAALARVLPALLLFLAARLVARWVTVVTWASRDPAGRDTADLAMTWLANLVLNAAVQAALSVLLLVGLLLTYAQLRAREQPLSTAGLWREANRTR